MMLARLPRRTRFGIAAALAIAWYPLGLVALNFYPLHALLYVDIVLMLVIPALTLHAIVFAHVDDLKLAIRHAEKAERNSLRMRADEIAAQAEAERRAKAALAQAKQDADDEAYYQMRTQQERRRAEEKAREERYERRKSAEATRGGG